MNYLPRRCRNVKGPTGMHKHLTLLVLVAFFSAVCQATGCDFGDCTRSGVDTPISGWLYKCAQGHICGEFVPFQGQGASPSITAECAICENTVQFQPEVIHSTLTRCTQHTNSFDSTGLTRVPGKNYYKVD
ncbi:hypothetical protein O181_087223 [Austropuccinia psidii MF-1]|uniref:Secreted protein n=1 Tax=Austropuccinia psidii MF-1 TaxID=1389203 RepID=A0A9Q3IPA1_9BASI|nr:hypothetical protein [Austropuccinia psidii MF-1]